MNTIDEILSLDPMEDGDNNPHPDIHDLICDLYKELKDCATWCRPENGSSMQRTIESWLDGNTLF